MPRSGLPCDRRCRPLRASRSQSCPRRLLPLWVTALCRGPGRSRPPLQARGLAVAMLGCPLQGFPSLRKRNKNA
ncbi:hypothetical protein BHM03_00057522 [Ensete ventricosum]|nr:hypothetical protein BHM03_00057522 [Ensete ventricosum]